MERGEWATDAPRENSSHWRCYTLTERKPYTYPRPLSLAESCSISSWYASGEWCRGHHFRSASQEEEEINSQSTESSRRTTEIEEIALAKWRRPQAWRHGQWLLKEYLVDFIINILVKTFFRPNACAESIFRWTLSNENSNCLLPLYLCIQASRLVVRRRLAKTIPPTLMLW